MKRMFFSGLGLAVALAIAIAGAYKPVGASRQADVQLPSTPLKFGVFTARFDPSGAFVLEGNDLPPLNNNWKLKGDESAQTSRAGRRECKLAVVSRGNGRGRRRKAEPARPLGRQNG